MFDLMVRILGRAAARRTVRQFTRSTAVDKSEGQPILTEEALVHAKTDSLECYIIHFYIAERDEVVNCEVPQSVGRYLEKHWRGTLCHKGGKFFSFEHEGEVICESNFPPNNLLDPSDLIW